MRSVLIAIFFSSILAVGCRSTVENASNEKINDYFSCSKAGGRIYSDGKTSLSYCEYNGQTFSYDG